VKWALDVIDLPESNEVEADIFCLRGKGSWLSPSVGALPPIRGVMLQFEQSARFTNLLKTTGTSLTSGSPDSRGYFGNVPIREDSGDCDIIINDCSPIE
jgi:hypothetical protein